MTEARRGAPPGRRPAPIERAFAVFTERFGDFKPPEHNLLGAPIAETVFEPQVGGHIVDRGVDGSECRWARILAYDPPDRVVFSWDIGPQWQIETDPSTPARSRSGSSPNPGPHPGRTGAPPPRPARPRLGRPSATASTATRAGRCTWPGTPPCSAEAGMPPSPVEVDRPAAEVFAYATDPPGSTSGSRVSSTAHGAPAQPRSATGASPPAASAAPTGRPPRTVRHRSATQPGACAASTGRSAPPSTSPSSRSPSSGPG